MRAQSEEGMAMRRPRRGCPARARSRVGRVVREAVSRMGVKVPVRRRR